MTRVLRCSTICLATLLMCVRGLAQEYRVDRSVVSSGGGSSTSASYQLSSTIGQPVVGFVKSAAVLCWAGFWSGDMPTPEVVQGIADAKKRADGAFISTSGKIVTSAAGDFCDFFYIEDHDRTGGIRVAASPDGVEGIARGSVVNVIGTIGTTAVGERQFTGPLVMVISQTTPLTPLGMNNRSLGGGDLGSLWLGQPGVTGGRGVNNVGLLVQTWGKVIENGWGYIMIDDGSGPVVVDTTILASQPAKGMYISVIGISSLQTDVNADRLRLVLPRGDEDIRKR